MIVKRKGMLEQITSNLSANLIQGILGLSIIPIATHFLGPVDYGIYAIAMAISTFITACCEFGYSYVIYGNAMKLSDSKRGGLICFMVILGAFIGSVAGFFLFIIWNYVLLLSPELKIVNSIELIILCSLVPIRLVWIIINPAMISMGRSFYISQAIIIQSIITFIVIISSLYFFNLERLSLFLGYSFGIGVAVFYSLYKSRKLLKFCFEWQWFRDIERVAPLAWFMGVLENIRPAIENTFMGRYSGLVEVGNFVHARQYHGMMMQVTNAFNNAAFPHVLKEAHNVSQNFNRARLVWGVVYIALSIAGVVFVFYGKEIVGFLTNHKFTLAAKWIPFLIIYLMIQHSGKAATAIMYSQNMGNKLSKYRIISLIIAIILLLFFVPNYGVNAILMIMIFEISLTRYLIISSAKRLQNFPFLDQVLFSGVSIILASYLIAYVINLDYFLTNVFFLFSIIIFGLMINRYLKFLNKYLSLFYFLNKKMKE
jgi:O-antigen/teichoic acid export membrane protein